MTYKRATGRKEYLRNRKGVKITFKQACLAKCFDCMGYYEDGRIDCQIENCPIYPFMPYRENRVK